MGRRSSKQNRVIVGVVYEGAVICVQESRLEGFLVMRRIEREGGTWGDLRRAAPEFFSNEIEERYWNYYDPDEIPDDEVPFSSFDVPGASDGDWPWLKSDMLDWLPSEIQQEFGEELTTTLNGNCLHIEPDRIVDLIVALEACGYSCGRDDEGLGTATGYD
jgi:hypothetical protein